MCGEAHIYEQMLVRLSGERDRFRRDNMRLRGLIRAYVDAPTDERLVELRQAVGRRT